MGEAGRPGYPVHREHCSPKVGPTHPMPVYTARLVTVLWPHSHVGSELLINRLSPDANAIAIFSTGLMNCTSLH